MKHPNTTEIARKHTLAQTKWTKIGKKYTLGLTRKLEKVYLCRQHIPGYLYHRRTPPTWSRVIGSKYKKYFTVCLVSLQKENPPWKAILTSIPMWGISVGHFGACWGYYTLFTQMPTYLKDIQHLDIKTVSPISVLCSEHFDPIFKEMGTVEPCPGRAK